MEIVKFNEELIDGCNKVWNDVVKAGLAFPQENELDKNSGVEFFKSQTYTGVALIDEKVVGLYILHPNNVGRCSHICNASYCVLDGFKGMHIGEELVKDCLIKAKEYGYKILQFNAVVESNIVALNLYEKLGFTRLGVIPKGFRNINGIYENIIPHYIEL